MSDSFDYMRKICMIGAGGSGKVQNTHGDTIRVKLLVWDLAGQERFDFIRTSYYKGSKGALLVFDVTRKSTWKELPRWLEEIDSALGQRVPIVLLANKVDLVEERVISKEDALQFIKEENLNGYLETSALNGLNIDEAFEILARATLT
ncbi:MAG: Rab family GTPase [Candidatus Thorarchaeota archaeon]|jgi:small GTP-binding protein